MMLPVRHQVCLIAEATCRAQALLKPSVAILGKFGLAPQVSLGTSPLKAKLSLTDFEVVIAVIRTLIMTWVPRIACSP